jgi:hypothetical protein
MKEISIEPLEGEQREKRSVLDWASNVVFALDFIKSRMGQKGVVEAGEHWGSIEKLAWKNTLPKLSPGEFLAATYKGNYEPLGFKAKVYEEHDHRSAVMVVTECPYTSFWRKCMQGIGSLVENDLCNFCHATFRWLSEFNYKSEWKLTKDECRLTLSRR